MQKFYGGLALGALLGVGGMFLVQEYVHIGTPEPECAGMCGDGTVCEQGRCLVAQLEVEPEAEPEDRKSKRKGRRGRRGASGSEDAATEPGKGPPIDDDSGVPRFNANEDQTIGMGDGSERLSDAVIDRELGKLDGKFQACVRDAAARVDELGTGTVKYSFGIEKTGKVTGVTASAPQNLDDAGLVPCVRKAVYGHKFPTFDGPTMKASSSFSVH